MICYRLQDPFLYLCYFYVLMRNFLKLTICNRIVERIYQKSLAVFITQMDIPTDVANNQTRPPENPIYFLVHTKGLINFCVYGNKISTFSNLVKNWNIQYL